MPVDFLAKWKQTATQTFPMESLGRAMSGWKYAPVGDSENSRDPLNKSPTTKAKECVSSKAFLRTTLVLAIILLLANLFSPARDQLRKYGYLQEPLTADGGSKGSEILKEPLPSDGVDWSQYAYCQYVTNEAYLCNSLMIFESLVRIEAKAERLMLYPEDWTVGDGSNTGRLLAKARDEYGVRLVPIHVQRFAGEPTWAESFTKLLAFNQTIYKRVLSLDSDATVLKPMDELFLLPSAPVAMPRAYWLDDTLSSQLVLIEPSKFEFQRILDALENRGGNDFDMEIVNNLYGKSCFIIPHRKYDLLTGEFKASEHHRYLGNKEEEWDPDKILDEAKFLHFSDWPYPKPWLSVSQASTDENQPKCHEKNGQQDCRDQVKWLWFYSDFKDRRSRVCGSGFKLTKREEAEPVAQGLPRRYEPVFR